MPDSPTPAGAAPRDEAREALVRIEAIAAECEGRDLDNDAILSIARKALAATPRADRSEPREEVDVTAVLDRATIMREALVASHRALGPTRAKCQGCREVAVIIEDVALRAAARAPGRAE